MYKNVKTKNIICIFGDVSAENIPCDFKQPTVNYVVQIILTFIRWGNINKKTILLERAVCREDKRQRGCLQNHGDCAEIIKVLMCFKMHLFFNNFHLIGFLFTFYLLINMWIDNSMILCYNEFCNSSLFKSIISWKLGFDLVVLYSSSPFYLCFENV